MSADFAVRWAVILAVTLVDAVWMWAKGIGVELKSLGPPLAMAGILVACAVLCSALARRQRRLAYVLLASADYLQSVTQLMLMILPLLALTYLAATTSFPLADEVLQRADGIIGFDWERANAWVDSYPILAEVLRLGYQSIQWQFFAVLFFVSVNRPGEVNGEFIWNFLVSLLLTTAIAAILPALGHGGAVAASGLEAMREIRNGGWTTFDLRSADGVITFPSFHAALGVLFVYSTRHERRALWAVLPLNALMILSTPTEGGHYLVDTIAGCLIACLSIALVRPIRSATARLRLERMAWPPGAPYPAASGER
ncbi:MAG TPA: phosphatase PAP2 family protein [Stellaceae bacterium]|nr:phosphatase PAP2 family protein [Stellaceae bacterium]